MKYIRTKDGIFEVIRVCQIDEIKEYVCKGKHNYGSEQVIKQADTIEELSDHLVVLQNAKKVHNGTFMLTEDNLPHEYWVNRAKEYYCAPFYYVFLGIWTLEGLKFVAKMNQKGEWELL